MRKSIVDYEAEPVFSEVPSDEDFELIKSLTGPGEIKKEDLFVYKVLLCDNMIDRDHERFTHKALSEMQKMFVGKIGIEDHNPTIKNAHSRIYKTELKTDGSTKNEMGEPYEYLVGFAYTIKNEKNSALISEIKGGLRKEVSVGVSCAHTNCSICNTHLGHGECKHKEGEVYNGKKCIGLLDDIDDVYEWSFVPIPSQRRAGVIKAYLNKEDKSMSLKSVALKIIKSAEIPEEDVRELMDAIDKVETPEDIKALQSENDKLREDLNKALKEIEENKVRRVEEFIDRLIDSMHPVNDKMRRLARRAIDELIQVDTDGKLTTESEQAIKDELESDEYRPLFRKDDVENKEIEIIEEIEDPKGCGKSHIDFSMSSSSAPREYKQKTGVMGVQFREK